MDEIDLPLREAPLPPFRAGQLATPDGAIKPYVIIGDGPTPMVVVPGAADGLRFCTEVAVYLAWFYRKRAANCRLLILSRRDPIPPQFGVARHAHDMGQSVDELSFGPAVWECLSAAGPIGQQVAVQRADLVQGLILGSTYDYTSPCTKRALRKWLQMAEHPLGSEAFLEILAQRYRPPAEVLAQIPAELHPPANVPNRQQRLQRLLQELLELDQRGLTPRIGCRALVVGGGSDRTVPPAVQREMAARILNCTLEIYPGFGHYQDMENPAYSRRVEEFAAWSMLHPTTAERLA